MAVGGRLMCFRKHIDFINLPGKNILTNFNERKNKEGQGSKMKRQMTTRKMMLMTYVAENTKKRTIIKERAKVQGHQEQGK